MTSFVPANGVDDDGWQTALKRKDHRYERPQPKAPAMPEGFNDNRPVFPPQSRRDVEARSSVPGRSQDNRFPAHERALQCRSQTPGCGQTSVTTVALEEVLRHQKAADNEYHKIQIKAGANRSYNVAEMDEHVDKNRYMDVLPFDYNRVILHREDEAIDHGYINASFLKSKEDEPGPQWHYIVTQGPLFETVVDFWQMVFEQRSDFIVMLTKVKELDITGRSVEKCVEYFPEAVGQVVLQGSLIITLQAQVDVTAELRRRTLLLHNTIHDDKVTVTHWQCLDWPDHGTPRSTAGIRKLVRLLKMSGAAEKAEGRPPIIHCSAGIGRSGAFLAIDIALRRLRAAQPNNVPAARTAVNLKDIVIELRKQRMSMVQTPAQYKFCYQALADELHDPIT